MLELIKLCLAIVTAEAQILPYPIPSQLSLKAPKSTVGIEATAKTMLLRELLPPTIHKTEDFGPALLFVVKLKATPITTMLVSAAGAATVTTAVFSN